METTLSAATPSASALPQSRLERVLQLAVWPVLLASSAAILAFGFSYGHPTLYFNLSYAWIVCWLFLAERHLPYRNDWREDDGQVRPDLGHTILNKGLVQLLVVSLIGLGALDGRSPGVLAGWPVAAQVAFGLVASELGLYWAHRIAHEWPWLWHFHAVHHSVRRLWLINTGRFHFVDSFASVFASMPFLLLSGISMDAIVWVSAITAYIGILTHCNVNTRCGWLNYVANTPELHRWHHSIDPAIGNNNYGENLMIWDHLFRSFYYRPRAHVDTIGIRDRMPSRFFDQLTMPFRWARYQAAAASP